MKVGVVLNPVAGGGRLKRDWPRAATALRGHFGDFELRETQAEGDAERLALDLAAAGFDLVVAAGGDGTMSEVADGLLQAAGEQGRSAQLGLLPCGTGMDFARGLGLPRDVDALVKRMADAPGRAVDAGRVAYVDDHGALASRHFINIASLGLSGAVDRAVNADRRKGLVSAKALFYWRTVSEFLRYRFQHVRIIVDDGAPVEASVALVAIANGKFFGGGMKIAPNAIPHDGEFDVIVIGGAPKLQAIKDLKLIYTGDHIKNPGVRVVRGRRVMAAPVAETHGQPVLIETDGENAGKLPATFEILPAALNLR